MDKSMVIAMVFGFWLGFCFVLFLKEIFDYICEKKRKSDGKEKEIPITYDKTLQVFDDLINKLKQLDNFKDREIVVDISARDGYSYIRVYARQESKNSYSYETLVDVKSYDSSISAITDLYMSAILELNKYFKDNYFDSTSRNITTPLGCRYSNCKNCDNRFRCLNLCEALEKEIKAYDYCNSFSTYGESRKNKKKEKDTECSRKLTGFTEFKTDDLVPLICKNCEYRAKNTTSCTLLEREIEATDYCNYCVVRRERNDI